MRRDLGTWLPLLISALSCAACGSERSGGYDVAARPEPASSSAAQLSELELAIVRSELGSLPPAPPPDPSNRYADDPAAAALGQKLFFDARYSENGRVSCATCHIPESGFQDDRANTSEGIGFTGRHAPTLLGAAYGSGAPGSTVWQFWDGRKDSLWSQALGPSENPTEMGGTRAKVALLIADLYRAEYEAVFGPLPALRDDEGASLVPESATPGTSAWQALDTNLQHDITRIFVNFGKAIAAYERKLVSSNSAFDRFWQELADGQSESDLLSTGEIEGLRVFIGKGACISCHQGSNFSDWKFHNIGVSQAGAHLPAEDYGRLTGIELLLSDEFNCLSEWSDQEDKAACSVSTLAAGPRDRGAFKTPSLRNASRTAPFFHTGTATTLADVVEFYDQGGTGSGYVGTLDENITLLNLTGDEKQHLLEFLATLEGEPLAPELVRDPTLPN